MSSMNDNSLTPNKGFDVLVRNVSMDEDYSYSLSTPDRRSPLSLNELSRNIIDTTDMVSRLLERSPGRKLLVISPKSHPRSPDQMQSFDFESPLSSMSGQQVILLSRHSKVYLAEQAVETKMRTQVLSFCFQFMKALKHWRRRLISKVFARFRRWAVANQYLKASEHKAHQKDILDQRVASKVLVSHHTASSRARTEKEVSRVKTPAKVPVNVATKPSFRPTSFNPMLQIQTKLATTPVQGGGMKKGTSPKKGSPTRQASVQYLNSKYFHPDGAKRATSQSKEKSRSTTPNSLVTSVSSLASHRFYQQSRSPDPHSTATTSTAAASPAEPGFDHKPLATRSLTSSTNASFDELSARIYSALHGSRSGTPLRAAFAVEQSATAASPLTQTPERQPQVARRSPLQVFQDSRNSSPTLSLSQRTPRYRPHVSGTLVTATESTITDPSAASPQSLIFLPATASSTSPQALHSPSTAEIAFARARGSQGAQPKSREESADLTELTRDNHSPASKGSIHSSEPHAELKSIVLPMKPRRIGKLQAVLSQHRSIVHSTRTVPLSGYEHWPVDSTEQVSEENGNVEQESTEQEVSRRSNENGDETEVTVSVDGSADLAVTTPAPVEYSKHYKYLAFCRVRRKICQQQDNKSVELRATSLATKYNVSMRLHRAILTLRTHFVSSKITQYRSCMYHNHTRLQKSFSALRARYLDAKLSRYRSYDSAINIDNFALTKAFWRLRRNVTHRHQSWFLEQRGAKYHRFLRLSQALSSLMQFSAHDNVAVHGDTDSVQDVGSEEHDIFKTAALLVAGLRGHGGELNLDNSDSDLDSQFDLTHTSDLVQDFGAHSSSDDDHNYSNIDDSHRQDLTQWEDQYSDTLSVHSDSSAEHDVFRIGAITPLGQRSGDNSPSPRANVDLGSLMQAPHDPPQWLHQTYPPYEPHKHAEILHQISKSRSDEFPGVGGIDMWDWQDLHSVSREFISDSEFDSSREAVEDSLARSEASLALPSTTSATKNPERHSPSASSAPATPMDVPNLKVMRRMSTRSLSISPIYLAETSPLSPLSPLTTSADNFSAEASHTHNSVGEQDENSDISLFLSDDSQDSGDGDNEDEDWSPSPQHSPFKSTPHKFSNVENNNNFHLDESLIAHSASPLTHTSLYKEEVFSLSESSKPFEIINSVRESEGATVELDLPPLPSSPCPSDEMDDRASPESASLSGYISASDADSVEVSIVATPTRKIVDAGVCLREARGYWRRTKLSQGLYALNQWVVRNQTILTMSDILYEYQALRKLRRGFKTLRNSAML